MSVLSDSQFDCVEDEWVDDEFDDAPFDLDAESDHGSQLLIEKLRSGFCPILLDATVLYSYVFYTLLKHISNLQEEWRGYAAETVSTFPFRDFKLWTLSQISNHFCS